MRTITIHDDDSAAPQSRQAPTEEKEEDLSGSGTVAFGATAYTVTEGEAAATIAVTLAPAPPEALTLSIPLAGKGGPGVTPEDWRLAVDDGGRRCVGRGRRHGHAGLCRGPDGADPRPRSD